MVTNQFPSKLPHMWVFLPIYTKPTVSQQCGNSLHLEPNCHEKSLSKPLKSSSFSSIGPYIMHPNMSTPKKRLWCNKNTKPFTKETSMMGIHPSPRLLIEILFKTHTKFTHQTWENQRHNVEKPKLWSRNLTFQHQKLLHILQGPPFIRHHVQKQRNAPNWSMPNTVQTMKNAKHNS
jgi:hypothetical protein